MAEPATQSGDRLLWLAAAVIACMGLAWLAIAAPWSAPDEDLVPGLATTRDATAGTATARTARADADVSDPLHLARLALEAGMLTEPAGYSAWTLFANATAADPGNRAAVEGLRETADALLGRGTAALEQGRYEDASAIAATIVSRLPDHAGAIALSQEVAIATAPPALPEPSIDAPPDPATRQVEAAPPVDPIPELHQAFRAAMASNAVLTPPGTSARAIASEMLALAPEHELTVAARGMLVTEMLDRSVQSIEGLDTVAAQTWIDSAAPLAIDARLVARAQERLTQHLIRTESQKLLPASELRQVRNVAPSYPEIALARGIEGWVEVEFVVGPDGAPVSVTVIDASHERYFRDEATAAVNQWRFEPVVFMDQPIAQRAYTRLAFVLD